MYFKYAKVLSLILFAVYYYKQTKNKVILYVILNVGFISICALAFKVLFPAIPLYSPTIEYLGFLVIVGGATLAMVIFIAKEIEKQKTARNEHDMNIRKAFELNKQNIFFLDVHFIAKSFSVRNGQVINQRMTPPPFGSSPGSVDTSIQRRCQNWQRY